MKDFRFRHFAVGALLVLLVGVFLTGCQSFAIGQTPVGSTPNATTTSPSSPTPTTPPSNTAPTTPPTTPTPAGPTPTAGPTASADVSAAVKTVIQRANDEQQQAYATHDPTVMKDTATADYYDQLVQTNNDMAKGGVRSFKLVKIEWGPITGPDQTTVEATTYETWLTTFTDSTTDQSRDRNVYTLVQEGGAWKIQADDHPDANPGGPNGPNPPGQLPPGQSIGSDRTDVSRNWSGYAATQGTFSAVSGTWTVPETNGTGSFGSGATWVGIGGVSSRDLIQAGTMETTNGNGRIGYEAWIEMLPAPMQPVSLAVNPGDSVTVSISEQSTGRWLVAMKDDTTGETYQTTVRYASSKSSAEWVEEAPSARRRIMPLEDFGTVQFSGGSTVVDGKSDTIAQVGAQAISMLDYQGNIIATPSPLTPDGTGFSINRSGTGSTG